MLTEEEIARLFHHLPMGDDQGCRNAAVVTLMVDCGLRLSAAAIRLAERARDGTTVVASHSRSGRPAGPRPLFPSTAALGQPEALGLEKTT